MANPTGCSCVIIHKNTGDLVLGVGRFGGRRGVTWPDAYWAPSRTVDKLEGKRVGNYFSDVMAARSVGGHENNN